MDIDCIYISTTSGYYHKFPKHGNLPRGELKDTLDHACQILAMLNTECIIAFEHFVSQTYIEIRYIPWKPCYIFIRVKKSNIHMVEIQGYLKDQTMYVKSFLNKAKITKNYLEYMLHILRYIPEPYNIAYFAWIPSDTTPIFDISSIVLGF